MTTHKLINPVEELIDAHAEIARLKAELVRAHAALEKYEPKEDPKPPPGYGEVLDSQYQLLLRDKGCNEPIGWGFGIKQKIEDKALLEALKTHGDIEFLHGAFESFEFGLIVRWLTEEEAADLYGPRQSVSFGPRKGFLQVVYGTKAFNHRKMKPAGVTS